MAEAAVGTSTRPLQVARACAAFPSSWPESAVWSIEAPKLAATAATNASAAGAAIESVHPGASVVVCDVSGRMNAREHPCARRAQAAARASVRRLRLLFAACIVVPPSSGDHLGST